MSETGFFLLAQTYILNPVNDQVLQVPDYTGVPETVIWDQEDRSTCVLVDENELHVYSYASETIDGPQITLISDENRKLGYSPIALFQGVMMFQVRGLSAVMFAKFPMIELMRPAAFRTRKARCGKQLWERTKCSNTPTKGRWRVMRRKSRGVFRMLSNSNDSNWLGALCAAYTIQHCLFFGCQIF